jgi:hypothetical protein
MINSDEEYSFLRNISRGVAELSSRGARIFLEINSASSRGGAYQAAATWTLCLINASRAEIDSSQSTHVCLCVYFFLGTITIVYDGLNETISAVFRDSV